MPVHVAKGAIIAISVIAAAAFAVYESPEVRQFAEDLRRRFAQTLHSMGDNVDPSERRRREQEQQGQPLFNRPEDAEGALNKEAGIDADEASRRRQREELAYWNHLREQRQAEASQAVKPESEAGDGKRKRTRSSSFGNFLQQDAGAGQGTYVLSSAVEPAPQTENSVVQRRVGRGIDRGAIFADPFGDEHGIELGERADEGWGARSQRDQARVLIAPGRDEVVSVASERESEDLYGAEDNRVRTAVGVAAAAGVGIAVVGITTTADMRPVEVTEMLIDTSAPLEPAAAVPEMQEEEAQYATPAQYPHSEAEATELDAYAAIHAWADNAHAEGFYSPLPTTPTVLSETEEGDFGSVSDAVVEGEGEGSEDGDGEGVATPRTVDSLSVIGGEGWESASAGGSEDGGGRSTPGSWTEVGSVVSSEAERGV